MSAPAPNDTLPYRTGSSGAADVPPVISVVVATCNGARGLPLLFDALLAQDAATTPAFEIVIVDNRSTDDTATIVRDYACRSTVAPIRYEYEARPGKSFALNTGLQAARGSILAFTDDDGIPSSTWLRTVVEVFERHPEIDCIGGRVELFNLDDADIAVRRSTQWQVVDLANFDESNIPIIGCNMAMRAAALRSVGPFDTALGPGSAVGVSEDVDILYRLLRAGRRIAYAPDLLVHHNHGRRTAADVERCHDGYVLGRGGLYAKYALRRDTHILRHAYWELRSLAASIAGHGWASGESRSSRRALRLLARGALRYLRYG